MCPYLTTFEIKTRKVEAILFSGSGFKIISYVRVKMLTTATTKSEDFHKEYGRQRSIELYTLIVLSVYWKNCTSLLGTIWTHFGKKVWEYQHETQAFVEYLDLKKLES